MLQKELSPLVTKLDELLASVALETGLSIEQMKSRSHRARYVRARSVFAERARRHGYNLVDIGEALGRSHCAIMNYLKKLEVKKITSTAQDAGPITDKEETMTTKKKPTAEDFENLSPEERRELVAILSKAATSKEERETLARLFRPEDAPVPPAPVVPAPAPADRPAKRGSFLDEL